MTRDGARPVARCSQAILPVFRGDIGVARDGRPYVENLFATFKASSLPDQVNEPTLARLNRFLAERKLNVTVSATRAVGLLTAARPRCRQSEGPGSRRGTP